MMMAELIYTETLTVFAGCFFSAAVLLFFFLRRVPVAARRKAGGRSIVTGSIAPPFKLHMPKLGDYPVAVLIALVTAPFVVCKIIIVNLGSSKSRIAGTLTDFYVVARTARTFFKPQR